MTLDTYIPISDAARLFHLAESQLYQWVQSGNIRAAMIDTTGVVVNEFDIAAQLPKEDQSKYQAVAYLKGQPIGIREASRKYKIPSPTISRWVGKGYIKSLGKRPVKGGYQVLIDEADIAYCAAIYQEYPRQGKRIFNPDGSPHHK